MHCVTYRCATPTHVHWTAVLSLTGTEVGMDKWSSSYVYGSSGVEIESRASRSTVNLPEASFEGSCISTDELAYVSGISKTGMSTQEVTIDGDDQETLKVS